MRKVERERLNVQVAGAQLPKVLEGVVDLLSEAALHGGDTHVGGGEPDDEEPDEREQRAAEDPDVHPSETAAAGGARGAERAEDAEREEHEADAE